MQLHTQHTQNKPGETLFGFLMLAVSIGLLWQSYSISGFDALSSPGTFPMAASAVMVITACIICFQNVKLSTPATASFSEIILPKIVAVMIGMVFVFAVLIDSAGFILTALVFLFSAIKVLHRSSVKRTLLLTLLILVLIYVVFRLIFKVVLPEGIIPEREIMAWVEDLFTAGGQ